MQDAHTLITGPCHSGKTVLLRHLAASGHELGAQVIAIDTVFSGRNFKAVAGIDTLAADFTESIQALEKVSAEITRRRELFNTLDVCHWTQIPEEVRDAEDVRPIFIFIDEWASTVVEDTLPRGVDREEDWYREAAERNADAGRVKYLVKKIFREARPYGAHVVIATQRPDLVTLGGDVREHLGNVIMMLRPDHNVRDSTIAMSFGMEHEAVSVAIQATADSEKSHGDGVLASSGGVQRFHVPYAG